MPLVIYQKTLSHSATLAIWKASESTAELATIAELTAAERSELESIALEKRKREWLCTRILMNLIGNGRKIQNLSNGKPILTPDKHISISHCGILGGIVISDSPIGMDIQDPDVKIERIKKKFCHPQEMLQLPGNSEDLEHLTVIWSAKEAIFKFFGEQVDFAHDIRLFPFHFQQKNIHARYSGKHGHREFDLYNHFFSGYHIVIAQ